MDGEDIFIDNFFKNNKKFISKCRESINHNLGMSDWMANNDEDFISKEVGVCYDYNMLSDLRANLRHKALNSTLFDTKNLRKIFMKTCGKSF